MNVFIVLIQNVTLLIAIITIYSIIIRRWEKGSFQYLIYSGILFGVTAVIGMTMPFTLIPGVIFDGRTIIHNIAGLFGGPYVALIAAIISSAYRYYLGGAGTLVGISTIAQSSLFGILFHYLHRRKKIPINTKNLIILSLLTNTVMLAMFTTIQDLTLQIVITQLSLPIMVLYPLTTLIIAFLMLKQQTEYDAQKALRISESRLAKTQDIARIGSWVMDMLTDKIILTPEASKILGVTSEEHIIDIETFYKIIHPDDFLAVKRFFNHPFANFSGNELEHRILNDSAKEIRHVYQKFECIKDNEGKIVRLLGMVQDITERKVAQESLKKSEALKGSIVDAIPDLIILFDEKGTYLEVLTNDEKHLIKPKDELIGTNLADYVSEDLAATSLSCIRNSLKYGSVQTMEYSLVTLAGFFDYESRMVKCGSNEVLAFIRDITDRKLYEGKLKYYSTHDHLTGIYNRSFFEESLTRLYNENNYPLSVISADIDGLKLINDTMGQIKGNEVLLALREIIRYSLRQKDIIARIDGDEYAVILPLTDYKTADLICNKIIEGVAEYNENPDNPPLSVSLGLTTVFNNEYENPLELLNKAEESMYRNKIPRQNSRSNRVVQGLIAALAERDYITDGHADRVQKLCFKLGEKVGLSSQQLSDIELLSRVHDLGKVGIPDRILHKPTRLDQEEWEIMRLHPEKGYRIASASIELAGIAPLILKHHEHWNGNGYPLKLKGDEIPIECRILSIVDAYDAMTNDRPYSKARTSAEALAEIRRCAGSQFDPSLVEPFESIVRSEKS